MTDTIPEEFWVKVEEVNGNPFEEKRLLEMEIDRLAEENKQLKALLQQTRIDRDTYHQDALMHERSNALLMQMYSKR